MLKESSRRMAKVIRNLIKKDKGSILWPIDNIGYLEIDGAKGGVGGTFVHVKIREKSKYISGSWIKIPTEKV